MPLPLPPDLQSAIQRLASGERRGPLAARSAVISAGYRDRRPSVHAVATAPDVAAYALTRLPATYAATEAALAALAARAPDFAPRSVLDLGCGPGTASWAATAAFPTIASATLIDRSGPFLEAARQLAAGHPVLSGATIAPGDLAHPPAGLFDLVVIGYALTELADPAAAIARIWRACRGALLVVEPGTPRDYQRLLAIRKSLLEQGATIVAPCPHQGPCQLVGPDWCHFAVRLDRSRDHRRVKGGTLGYEDEKFSYLAVVRPALALTPPAPRVLARPRESKYATTLKLCNPDGIVEERTVAKRDATAFRAIRRKDWGDAL